MAESIKYVIFVYIFTAASSIPYVAKSALAASCGPQSCSFLHDLQFQCPLMISTLLPVEIDGESLDRALSSGQTNLYTAVLFYASWCPFSNGVQAKFAILSSMFPRIKHIMVEQSLAMPSVLSRYGIHSLPSILIVNQTERARYHGPKDLRSFVNFYKRTTGLDPVAVPEDKGSYFQSGDEVVHPWNGNSPKDIVRREPYLVFSAVFLFLRVVLYFFPGIISRFIALWAAYIPRLNVGMFGESSQLLGRVLHLIDVKRVWSKLKLCKTRNFHNGARSARVWASSLASVSLGETSMGRSFASGDS